MNSDDQKTSEEENKSEEEKKTTKILKFKDGIKNGLKQLSNKKEKDDYQIDVGGVFISEKLITKESKRSCPVCDTYSFKSNDDVYMAKFDCCEKCYIQWVEDREERWLKGWRPNNE